MTRMASLKPWVMRHVSVFRLASMQGSAEMDTRRWNLVRVFVGQWPASLAVLPSACRDASEPEPWVGYAGPRQYAVANRGGHRGIALGPPLASHLFKQLPDVAGTELKKGSSQWRL